LKEPVGSLDTILSSKNVKEIKLAVGKPPSAASWQQYKQATSSRLVAG
jgi:hypothetical protein